MLHFAVIFFVLLLLFCVSSRKNLLNENNTKKSAFVISLVILGSLSAFKASTVGNDTHEYLRLFEMGDYALSAETRYEIGYLFFSVLVHKISQNDQILFVAYSVLLYLLLGRFLWKHSAMPWLSVMLFFSYTLFGFTMSALRQSLAIVILFFSYDFLIKKRYLYFCLLVILASLFHSTAIFFIITPFVIMLKPTRKTLATFVVITILAYLLFRNILTVVFDFLPYYAHYQDGVYFDGETRVSSVFQLLLSLMFFGIGYYAYNAMDESDNAAPKKKLGMLVMMQAMAVFFSVMSLKANILDRIVLYYSSFLILLIPNTIMSLTYKKRRRLSAIVLLAVFLYTSTILIYRPEWNSVFPYQFYWNEPYRQVY